MEFTLQTMRKASEFSGQGKDPSNTQPHTWRDWQLHNWAQADTCQSRAAPTLAPWALTSLVQPSKGLKVPGVAEGLQLLFRATCQEADEVQAVQLELQGAVELLKALPVGGGPSGKKGKDE